MTSDAKIGLLLGLVFIFVIAFIINGLPNLKPQQTIHANVPTIVGFSDPEVGVGGQAQAQAERDWSALANEQESAPVVQTPVEQVAPMVQTPLQQPETANSQDVRYETLLPGAEAVSPRTDSPLSRIDNPLARIENLLERFTAGQQSQTTSTINMAPEQPATVERQPTVQTQQPRTEVRPTETVTRTAEQLRPAGTASARPVGKIYVVGEGESLSTVAKKVYGPEEGNRYVNINRIYEANKDILKSVHEVVAGQKLVIPPLPKPTANPNKPSDVLSRDLFEKVETINKRPAAQTQPQTAPVAAGSFRWYTVQDGDNLWKIASSQLGAGARYDEIAKLNTDVLKNGEKLDLGMKIRLPLK
jgi:nucleoid-associated protein YgaU